MTRSEYLQQLQQLSESASERRNSMEIYQDKPEYPIEVRVALAEAGNALGFVRQLATLLLTYEAERR